MTILVIWVEEAEAILLFIKNQSLRFVLFLLLILLTGLFNSQVFLDEVNTSPYPGFIKELIIDGTIDGRVCYVIVIIIVSLEYFSI